MAKTTKETNAKLIQQQKTQAIADAKAKAKQDAIDNASAEDTSALNSAEPYGTMNMSKAGMYDQLISAYGGKFTPSQAQYAKNNLKK